MEEVNSPPHSMGSGQPHQHPVNHSRPFFYVQPPSQPYYMYQWHMNNPYSHYGFPGSGLHHFGRPPPYMAPYPYMQCPGYVIPHAPMQPIDYRRIFNPHLPSAASYDIRFRHHQTHVRRETACSEAQTDPSDAVNKIIERLEKLRTHGPVIEKELDSGIVSQGSGSFLIDADSKRQELAEETEALPVKVTSSSSLLSESEGTHSTKSITPSSSLPGITGKTELSHRHFEGLVPEEGWTEGPDEVLPLDSSSIHEESMADKDDEEEEEEEAEGEEEFALHCVPEKLSSTQTVGSGSSGDVNSQAACAVKVQSESTQGQQPSSKQDNGAPSKKTTANSRPSPESAASRLSSWLAEEGAREQSSCEVPKAPLTHSANTAGRKGEVPEKPAAESGDLPYRILRLPCDKVTTAGLLPKDDPLWYMDSLSTLIPPHTYLSSFGNTAAYYYSYYPPVAPERQSVLSPSLDELSSRDEMFSTDIEDLDVMSGQIYTGGRLAEARHETADSVGDEGEGKAKTGSFQKECPICPKMKKCATCGSCLQKDPRKSKARYSHGMYDYRAKEETDEEAIEEDEDEDDDGKVQRNTCELRKATPKRPPHSKRPFQQPPVWQPLKTKSKKGYCEHPSEPVSQEEAPEYLRVMECCEEHKTMAKAERYKGQEPRSAQSRPHPDRQRRESSMASELESWESCRAKPRPCKLYPPSRGEEKPLRRTPCKTFVCPRSRRTDCEEDEEEGSPHCHRGRGSTKRWHKTQN